MKTNQIIIKNQNLLTASLDKINENDPQLGIVFASTNAFESADFIQKLKKSSPKIQWVGCSTAGEVSRSGVTDDTTILTTIHFDNPKSNFRIAASKVTNADDSYAAGKRLAEELNNENLRGLVVMAPGVNINGSQLVKGASEAIGNKVVMTGGLAGDGGKFVKTYTLSPSGVSSDHVIGIGFYGDTVNLQYGCRGGWDAFGKERKVTKSKANILYELDGKPALDVYKEYLGEYAKDLPASGLMFPFSLMSGQEAGNDLIRTILGINEAEGSLTLAGNIEQGSTVRLMHASTGGLVNGAKAAATHAIQGGRGQSSLAIIVSCVGRKLVMGANVDEEIEEIAEMFGPQCTLTGFYSYGEISPFGTLMTCELHNQTMTISYIYEN
ncbi:MAG: FIST signal transduction protein [Bdellovibrionales bacterium]